jgi:RNA polymerase sigma factor (sigma-70 family)
MLDKKYERYWDNLDIDKEWEEILNAEFDKDKKSDNAYYKNTRSANKITEELIFMLINNSGNESDFCSNGKTAEMTAKIKYEIKCLTDRQRLAVELYFFQRKKQREIADILGCKRRNVSDLILRSLKRIAKKLNK